MRLWKYLFVRRRSMVVGNSLRFLMICKCSSWGSCMREGIFALVCLRMGGLEDGKGILSFINSAIENRC